MKKILNFRWILAGLVFLLVFGTFITSGPQIAQAASTAPSCRLWYSVKTGETLNIIARRYNVMVQNLVKVNNLVDPYTIYVDQFLCIPRKAPAYSLTIPKYANNLAADFTVTRKSNVLTISTSNFPKKSAYYVKIADSTTPKKFTKVGILQIDKKQNVTVKFILSNKLRKTQNMQVCLKNSITDENICRPVE
jgi:LysM repeat protein